jgi:HPt (histidine-containing phosphotransfer) domain-containing protein
MVFNGQGLLNRVMGDRELALTVIRAFCDDTPRQIGQLQTLVETNDTEHAGKQAHKIKGAALNIGGVALAKVALHMEQVGRAGNTGALRELLPELERAFLELKDSIVSCNP